MGEVLFAATNIFRHHNGDIIRGFCHERFDRVFNLNRLARLQAQFRGRLARGEGGYFQR